MTADYLFRLGQDSLLGEDVQAAEKFLKLASEKGHEEAIWLVALMHKMPYIPKIANDYDDIRTWCRSLFNNDDSDRALCYRLWFTEYSDEPDLELIKYAADTGNAVGQYNYYVTVSHRWELRTPNKSIIYLEKAAEQNLLIAIEDYAKTIGINCSTHDIKDRQMQLYLRGAELGDLACISKVSKAYIKILDESIENRINAIKWLYRKFIHGGQGSIFAESLNTIKSHMSTNSNLIYSYFTVGRETDGYDEFFPRFNNEEHDTVQEAIEFYRRILDAARKSALCTLWMLRPVLSKDIAIIIAKLIYDSRLDPIVWVYVQWSANDK